MASIVQKFGGSSLASVELIKKAALRIKFEYDANQQVAVVLSAMGGMTDQLVEHIRDISSSYDRAEYDTVVSAGEQISVGLMVMALHQLGLPARSWLGWQLPIHTSPTHSSARIQSIDTKDLKASLNQNEIAVVAGFQGLSPQKRITTLGRGGSDTTAVALAVALNADRCDIYTDVEGVYTADPRFVSKAGKLDQIAYQEMLELSTQGAKVLQRDSVELAMKHGLKLRVLSSQSHRSGTLISHENTPQSSPIRGVVQSQALAQIYFHQICRKPLEDIKQVLDTHDLPWEMLRQTISPCGQRDDISFVIPQDELEQIQDKIKMIASTLKNNEISINQDMSKISIVGPNLSEKPNLVQKLFHTLSEKGIQVADVNTSDIKVSVLIKRDETTQALSVLHTAYNLDVKDS